MNKLEPIPKDYKLVSINGKFYAVPKEKQEMAITPIGDNFWSFGDGEQSIVLHLLDIPTTLSINATKTEYGY